MRSLYPHYYAQTIRVLLKRVEMIQVEEEAKCSYKGDSFIIFRSRIFKRDTVSLHIREVLLGFLRCASSQTWNAAKTSKGKHEKFEIISYVADNNAVTLAS